MPWVQLGLLGEVAKTAPDEGWERDWEAETPTWFRLYGGLVIELRGRNGCWTWYFSRPNRYGRPGIYTGGGGGTPGSFSDGAAAALHYADEHIAHHGGAPRGRR